MYKKRGRKQETTKTAEEYDDRYIEVMTRALDRYRTTDQAAKRIAGIFSKRERISFAYVNAHARRIFRRNLNGYVLKRFQKSNLEKKGIALVTFIEREWARNDQRLDIPFSEIKQKVRNALKGLNFIGVIECAFYLNERLVRNGIEGKLICTHVHAIAWASSYSKLERRRKRIKKHFKPVLDGPTSGAHFSRRRKLLSVVKASNYMTKMTTHGYRVDFH